MNDRLRARGASDTDSLKKLYDINGAIGGPIKRDKLWFYFTSRYFTNEYYMAGQYFAVDPSAFVRTSDLTRQAFSGTWTADNNIRVTWAPTVKQKISGWYAYQRKDDAHWLQQILFMSPEAAQLVKWPTQLSTITWTYTATNRVLLEAGMAPGESPDTIVQPPENKPGRPGETMAKASTRSGSLPKVTCVSGITPGPLAPTEEPSCPVLPGQPSPVSPRR